MTMVATDRLAIHVIRITEALLEGDGRTTYNDDLEVTLKIEPDEYQNPFDESDELGEIVAEHSMRGETRSRRPSHFNGQARRLECYGYRCVGGYYWWQPPEDMKNADKEAMDRMAAAVKRLIEDGYYVITVNMRSTSGGGISSSSLCGLDPTIEDWHTDEGRAYRVEIVQDLVQECLIDFWG